MKLFNGKSLLRIKSLLQLKLFYEGPLNIPARKTSSCWQKEMKMSEEKNKIGKHRHHLQKLGSSLLSTFSFNTYLVGILWVKVD